MSTNGNRLSPLKSTCATANHLADAYEPESLRAASFGMTIEIRLSFSGDERKIKMVGFYRPVEASDVFLYEVCHLKTFFHVFLVK